MNYKLNIKIRDIPEELITKFKLSTFLSNNNPLRILIKRLEEKSDNGYIYKSFCLFILIFSLAIMGLFLIYNQYLFLITLPLSLLLFLVIYSHWSINYREETSKSVFYNILRRIPNTIYLFIIMTFFSLLLINMSNNPPESLSVNHSLPLALLSANNIYISYSIIIGSLLLILPDINDVYAYYVRFRMGTDFGNSKKYARSFAHILLSALFIFMIYFIYNYELFTPRNAFFQTVFIISLASMIAYLMIVFNIIMFLFIYWLAKLFDKVYT